MAAQAGNINEFESMNVIQRESLAKAFGMNVDQMGAMLMRQEAMTQLQGEASKASDAQLAAARELMKTDKEKIINKLEKVFGESDNISEGKIILQKLKNKLQ